jgi:hypothetical protein
VPRGVRVQLQLDLDDLLDLHQEPRVDLGDLLHLVQRPAGGEGVAHVPDALGAGLAQLLFEQLAVLRLLVHAVHAHFQAAQRLLERFLEGAADGHHLAHDFICVVRRLSAAGTSRTRNAGSW